MKTKQIINEYSKRKRKLKLLQEELKHLEQLLEGIQEAQNGKKKSDYSSIEDYYIKNLEKKHDLEMQRLENETFIKRVNYALKLLKTDSDEMIYEIFYRRYFQGETLEAIAEQFNYSTYSGVSRRIKKLELEFEELINV